MRTANEARELDARATIPIAGARLPTPLAAGGNRPDLPHETQRIVDLPFLSNLVKTQTILNRTFHVRTPCMEHPLQERGGAANPMQGPGIRLAKT